MGWHNKASDAIQSNLEFEALLQQKAAEWYARELTEARLKQLAQSTGPASLLPDQQAAEDEDQARYLANWRRTHPQATRRQITRKAIRDFVGLLVILAVLGWLFWQWVQPGGWLR